MPDGFSVTVIDRLWKLITAIRVAVPKHKLPRHLKCSERTLVSDIKRLKTLGIDVSYSRSKGIYYLNFPTEQKLDVTLKDKELFSAFYLLSKVKNTKHKKLYRKLNINCSDKVEPVYNCTPENRIEMPIGLNLQEKFDSIERAIVEQYKIMILYCKVNGEEELRLVHPYKLIHTPVSWYLVGWCQERNDFRNFKLIRIKQLKLTPENFKRHNFNIVEHLGDSWWLQHSPKNSTPYNIKVKFFGEAAQSIQEYNFHNSQKVEKENDDCVIVSWQMSYIKEFATWLMQWLESIEIIQPQELKDIVDGKIKSYYPQMTQINADEESNTNEDNL